MWVAAVTFATMAVGNANNWPLFAMQLRTAEPVASQLALSILGALAGGVVSALLVGLLAGVAAWYARAQPTVALAGRAPAWLAGAAAALATAGIAAALAALVPPTMPVWPDAKLPMFAWPWLGALTSGLAFVPSVAVTLFLLAVLDRATAGWTRRLPLAALALVLCGIALAIAGGRDGGHALFQGVVEGLATFAMAWLVLRYDLATVPAFVATGMALQSVKAAALAATGAGYALCAVTVATVIALAFAATRYLADRKPNASA
jgi:hypothetical protein